MATPRLLRAVVATALAVPLLGAVSVAPAAASTCTAPIREASVMKIQPCDDLARRVAKAAAVVPRAGQLAWQQRPVTGFTHFGMNTFTDREWGSGAESEQTFDPARVDTDQWMRSMRAAGITQVMMTAKHHDGFVLYPTRYTNHSVVASPWWVRTKCTANQRRESDAARAKAEQRRGAEPSAYWRTRASGCVNPRGDILGDYVRSAHKYGLKVGVYLSPADGSELTPAFFASEVKRIEAKQAAGESLTIEEQATLDDKDRTPAGQGRYASGSAVRPRTIPTLVPGDDRRADVRAGRLPSFHVTVDDYNAYYLNQLYELFTQYGPIDELWLDGANPWKDTGAVENYDFTAWFRLIHALSPDTVTFAGPQGVRWVGNEDGQARETEWSPLPTTADPDSSHNEELLVGGAQAADLGSRTVLADESVRYLQWAPAEADVSIRPGWFWHADEQPKTAEQLVGIYRNSVGRNASLLLNVPPATDGRVAAADVAALTGFGRSIRATERRNVVDPSTGAARRVTDGRLDTSWSPAAGATTGTLQVPLRRNADFDQIQLGEDIGHGQHVEAARVFARIDGRWHQLAAVTTIGYRRIVTLDAPVRADALRVVIDASRAVPRIATVAAHRTVAPTAVSTT